jgi:hypothetical protein
MTEDVIRQFTALSHPKEVHAGPAAMSEKAAQMADGSIPPPGSAWAARIGEPFNAVCGGTFVPMKLVGVRYFTSYRAMLTFYMEGRSGQRRVVVPANQHGTKVQTVDQALAFYTYLFCLRPGRNKKENHTTLAEFEAAQLSHGVRAMELVATHAPTRSKALH